VEGKYKSTTGSDACRDCGAGETTQIGASQRSSCSTTSSIDPATAEVISSTISTTLGIVIATNVAVAVGTAVGSAVVGGVAGGVGGGVGGGAAGGGGGGSSGGTMALITQVQFLNLLGRAGGSDGSETVAGITDGLSWANYDIGLFSPLSDARSSRRRLKQRRRLTQRRKTKVKQYDDMGAEKKAGEGLNETEIMIICQDPGSYFDLNTTETGNMTEKDCQEILLGKFLCISSVIIACAVNCTLSLIRNVYIFIYTYTYIYYVIIMQ